MKKVFLLFLLALTFGFMCGCGDKPTPNPNPGPVDPVDPGDPTDPTDPVDPVVEYTLTVSPEKLDLYVGDEAQITATVTPTTSLLWSSSNNGVATIKDGKVKAVASGKATITVSTEDGSVKKEIAVTVNEVEHNEIEDLKRALKITLDKYLASDSFNALIETSKDGKTSTMQMIYNKKDGLYDELFYEVKGNVTVSTYVKGDVSYMLNEGVKRKATLFNNERLALINDYNGNEFLEKVASFYDEAAFYNALEVVSATEFKLIPNKYSGTSLNVNGIDQITLKVTFNGEYVSKVELIYSNGSKVTVEYRGFDYQTIKAPNDLSSYTE